MSQARWRQSQDAVGQNLSGEPDVPGTLLGVDGGEPGEVRLSPRHAHRVGGQLAHDGWIPVILGRARVPLSCFS